MNENGIQEVSTVSSGAVGTLTVENTTAEATTVENRSTEASIVDNRTADALTLRNGTADILIVGDGTVDASTVDNGTSNSLSDDTLSNKINNITNNLRRMHELNLKNMELVCNGLELLETMDQRLSNMKSNLEKLDEKIIQQIERFPILKNSKVEDEERRRYDFRNNPWIVDRNRTFPIHSGYTNNLKTFF